MVMSGGLLVVVKWWGCRRVKGEIGLGVGREWSLRFWWREGRWEVGVGGGGERGGGVFRDF